MDHEKSGYKVVYTIVERRKDEKSFWTRIGVAFVNRDGSWNVHLDAVPVNGKLHIRDPKTPEERAAFRSGGAGASNGNGHGLGNGHGNGRGPEDVPDELFPS